MILQFVPLAVCVRLKDSTHYTVQGDEINKIERTKIKRKEARKILGWLARDGADLKSVTPLLSSESRFECLRFKMSFGFKHTELQQLRYYI